MICVCVCAYLCVCMSLFHTLLRNFVFRTVVWDNCHCRANKVYRFDLSKAKLLPHEGHMVKDLIRLKNKLTSWWFDYRQAWKSAKVDKAKTEMEGTNRITEITTKGWEGTEEGQSGYIKLSNMGAIIWLSKLKFNGGFIIIYSIPETKGNLLYFII